MISEAILKKSVADYLETGRQMGKWYYERLQSGTMIADYNGAKRAIRMCRNGTADFMVFEATTDDHDIESSCLLYFLELKTPKTKQNADQIAFQEEVTKHGAEYYVVRSVEELMKILPLEA